MLALIGFGVLVCVIIGIYLVQSFGKVWARLDDLEQRLDMLMHDHDADTVSVEQLPPPQDQ
jgi:hypothetical protein